MFEYASEVLCKTILPYVIGVHGLGIPYPARLMREDGPASESGSVIFCLDERGSLIAEYFAYDVHPFEGFHLSQSLDNETLSVRLVDTGVELPVSFVNASRKTSTIHNHIDMPMVSALECAVTGWIGDSSAEIKSAVATLDGCAILPLLSRGKRAFLGAGEGENGLPFSSYSHSRTSEVIHLTAGGWEVSIHSLSEDKRDTLNDEPPYSLLIKRSDGSTFQLPEQSGILRILALLLSFSSERWVRYSTVYRRMPRSRPDVVNRAFVGRFTSRGWGQKREVSIPELRDWPAMFARLWNLRESPQMRSALTHIVSCGERSKQSLSQKSYQRN